MGNPLAGASTFSPKTALWFAPVSRSPNHILLANCTVLQYHAFVKDNDEDRMPTVLRVGRFRFYFFSNEGQEPPHIHVQAAGDQAKFWLEPIRLAANYGFAARDLNEIERIIREHQSELLEAWNEYFS